MIQHTPMTTSQTQNRRSTTPKKESADSPPRSRAQERIVAALAPKPALGRVRLPEHLGVHEAPRKRAFAIRTPAQATLVGVLSLLLIAVLFAVVMAIGIYGFGWNGRFTSTVIERVPFPIAAMGMKLVPIRAFRSDIKTSKHFYEAQAATMGGYPQPSDERLAILALDHRIRQTYIETVAAREGFTVSQEAIDAELTATIEKTGGQAAFEESIKALYDWSLDAFKTEVLRPYLLRQKVQEWLDGNATFRSEARERAEAMRAKIAADGKNFDAVAEQESDSDTIDLGFFAEGDAPQEFWDALKAIQPGETSAVVELPNAFAIAQLTERIDDKEEGIRIRAKRIIILVQDLDAWVDLELKDKHVLVFDRKLRWNQETRHVEERPSKQPVNASPPAAATTNSPAIP